ncbi:uncharacterized protein LOC142224989 [Haematobia irritans]|uniref:uncharacterized protein LOC142224989 n=1 Tax=Haematobia irritans TaxID=7368 RepID=UPI003F50110E
MSNIVYRLFYRLLYGAELDVGENTTIVICRTSGDTSHTLFSRSLGFKAFGCTRSAGVFKRKEIQKQAAATFPICNGHPEQQIRHVTQRKTKKCRGKYDNSYLPNKRGHFSYFVQSFPWFQSIWLYTECWCIQKEGNSKTSGGYIS